jgi:hypothetical protein
MSVWRLAFGVRRGAYQRVGHDGVVKRWSVAAG